MNALNDTPMPTKAKSLYLIPQSQFDIIPAVERYFKLPENALYRRTRKREISGTRQIAIWLHAQQNIKESGYAKYREITSKFPGESEGKQMGYATGMHAVKNVNNLMSVNGAFRSVIYKLQREIFGEVLFILPKNECL